MARIKTSEKDIITALDRIPPRSDQFDKLRKKFASLSEYYGFGQIETPPIESAREFGPLIKGGFLDDRNPVLCKSGLLGNYLLAFSGLLSSLRAYITHGMHDLPQPVKLSFDRPVFFLPSRRDTAVRGLSECGLFMAGEEGPVAEAETIQILWKILDGMGVDLKEFELRVNAVGCPVCFPSYRSALAGYFRSRASRLCRSCRHAVKSRPVRALMCADEKCKVITRQAPQVLDFLCEACKRHLRGFLEFLDEMKVPYYLDSKFFRDGLWFHTILFEFAGKPKRHQPEEAPVVVESPETPPVEGEAVAEKRVPKKEKEDETPRVVLGEGGRFSRAAEILCGKKIDAVGVEIYTDRLIAFLSRRHQADARRPQIFLTHLGELAKRKSLILMEILRAGGIEVKESLGKDSIKSQLKVAEKIGAKLALIVGQKEALDDTIIVREVGSGIQETIPQEKLIDFLKQRLKK